MPLIRCQRCGLLFYVMYSTEPYCKKCDEVVEAILFPFGNWRRKRIKKWVAYQEYPGR